MLLHILMFIFEKKKKLLKWSSLFAQGAVWNCPRTHSGPLLLQKKVKFGDILPEINICRPWGRFPKEKNAFF